MKNQRKIMTYFIFFCFLFASLSLPLTARAAENEPKFNFILSFVDKFLSADDTITLRPDSQEYLDARVVFSNGDFWSVSSYDQVLYPAEWRSSDPQVVTVSSGALKGLTAGEATVTASYRGQSASVKVRVSPVVALVPSLIGEEPSGSARMEGENVLALKNGSSASMALTAVLADGTREDVTSASEWMSENEDIVFIGWVRNWGLIIHGLAEGTAVVTASLDGMKTDMKVEVTPEMAPQPPENSGAAPDIQEGSGNAIPIYNKFLEDAIRRSLQKPEGEITRADLAGLESLYLSTSSFAGNFSGLEYAVNLKKLSLSCDPDFKDISALAGLTNLEELIINQGGGVSDLTPLAGLKNLQKLDLYADKVSDLSPLSKLSNLHELIVAGNHIYDVQALADLNNLKRLNLQGVRISDVSPLAGLKELQTLIICNTRVEDISPLSGLSGLTHLDLNNNMIEDISPLAKLSNLEYLSLWNNKTSDLTPLSGLDRLMYLALSANRISDISPLASGNMGSVLIRIHLEGNSLPLEENSPAMTAVRKLNAGKVDVRYDPQRGYAYGVKVYVNGGPVSFPDQQPFIDLFFQRTYVPLRFVSEALGAKVDWEGAGQKVVISKGDKIIGLQIGSKEAVSNGEELFLDTVPLLVEGRTMVPLRFISEALGVEVNWTPDGEGGRVDVNY